MSATPMSATHLCLLFDHQHILLQVLANVGSKDLGLKNNFVTGSKPDDFFPAELAQQVRNLFLRVQDLELEYDTFLFSFPLKISSFQMDVSAVIHPRCHGHKALLLSIKRIHSSQTETVLLPGNDHREPKDLPDSIFTLPDHGVLDNLKYQVLRRREAELALKRKMDYINLLMNSTSRIVQSKTCDFNDTLISVLADIGDFFQVDRAYLFSIDLLKQTHTNTHEWCAPGITPQIDAIQEYPLADLPMIFHALSHGENILIEDVDSLPTSWQKERVVFQQQSIKSLVAVPVLVQGNIQGFMGLDSVKKTMYWTHEDAELLRLLANDIFAIIGRNQLEERQSSLRMQLRTILDTVPGYIFVKDYDGIYLMGNKYLADLLNTDIEGIAGKSDADYGLGSESMQTYVYNLRKVIDEQKPFVKSQDQLIKPDGQYGWFQTILVPFQYPGQQKGAVLGVSIEITRRVEAEEALKRSEEEYRLLIENQSDLVVKVDPQGKFLFVSPSYCRIFGKSADELLAHSFIPMVHPDDVWSTQKAMEDLYRPPYTCQLEQRALTVQGWRWFSWVDNAVLNAEGQVEWIIGVGRDITAQKEAEQLREEIAVARQSAQFKQNFLANMSHEIRTPLTGIIGMIEILADTPLDEHQADYINTLRLSSENLREVINQILDYSRIEAGHVMAKPRVFRTREVFDNARKLFDSICKKPIDLRVDVADDFPEYLKADEQRLNQVIMNLLSNAIKFTHEGRILLKAHVEQELDEQERLIRIEVADTGIGIKKEKIPLLFKPFSQIDHRDIRSFEGTGLGLSICKELVAILGGEIGVVSKAGKGSCFWFTFKARKVTVVLPEMDAQHEVLGNIKALRILFVEDKQVNQKVIMLMLKKMGHQVQLAGNGQEALEVFQPGIFDLILMDIQMPVMDGITATLQLRKLYPSLPPIVGLSANAFEGDKEKYMNIGMDEYLTKPVKREDFLALLHRLYG